jgi:hypothetical protein
LDVIQWLAGRVGHDTQNDDGSDEFLGNVDLGGLRIFAGARTFSEDTYVVLGRKVLNIIKNNVL